MEGDENSIPKDYYKILEVDYDATDEKIKLNYRRLALKWHPDKHQGDSAVTAKFQEINEAYEGAGHGFWYRKNDFANRSYEIDYDLLSAVVLSDPAKRIDYDLTGIYEIENYTLREYLGRFKGMILTCNGLGIGNASIWTQQLTEANDLTEK